MEGDDLIRVSEMAALHGVSRQTLILYDRNGLLKPEHVGANGYRYYSIDQVPRLRLICLLKEMGVPLKIEGDKIICDVIQGGVLKPNKTVNIPDVNLTFPVLTEKDRKDIMFAVENNFDYVCASFVRNREDVHYVRDLIGSKDIGIISKIENREGVNNFDEILEASDGVMIARGDLAVEIDYEEVPILQKQMIHRCRAIGKPVIVATQMLESIRVSVVMA